MAGYTRQSVAKIINGENIQAPPLNAEFNALLAAFNSSTGHTHGGGTGEAPPIPLSVGVSGYLLPVHGGTGGLNNTTASADPTANSDNTQGYAPGSIWINAVTARRFECFYNTTGGAVWVEMMHINPSNQILAQVTNTVDIGSALKQFKDIHIDGTGYIDSVSAQNITTSGNATIGGDLALSDALSVGGASVFGGTVTITSGTMNGVPIGSVTPQSGAFSTVTATSGISGSLSGDVTGNLIGDSTGTHTGGVTGDTVGNVTATSGTSSFNDVLISGTLNMDGASTATIENLSAPVNATDAARKIDVDTAIANLIESSPGTLDTLNELAAALGDDPSFSATVTSSIATKLPLAGGSLSGILAMGNNKITGLANPVATQDAATKAYADANDILNLSKTGGTLSGPLAMGNNKITDVGTPTANKDAASKEYVDVILGSATVAASSASNAAISESNSAASASNSSGSASAASSSASSAATSEANAAASYDSFDDRYLGALSSPPTVDNDGGTLITGSLYFNSTSNIMYVFGGEGWQSSGSSVNGTSDRNTYTASSGQTVFAAIYDTGYVDVYLNGLKLISGTDFVATNGTNIVLDSGATVNDTVDIVAYGTFVSALHYTEVQADARFLQLSGGTLTGDLGVTGTATVGGLSASGDLTLDVAGNIILDADGGEIEFKDGGTTFGNIAKSGNNLRINQGIQDGDIVFSGNDGGSIITALTLDMSDAGAATFSSTLATTELNVSQSANSTRSYKLLQGYGYTTGGNYYGQYAIGTTYNSAANTGTLEFFTGSGSSAPTNRLTIDSSGNVILAAGTGTLQTATAGTSNFRAGVNAGNSIIAGGNYNTVVGDEAGTSITTGVYNVALGKGALELNTTASHNTAIGFASGSQSTGAGNTLIGSLVGAASVALTTGTSNTIVGAYCDTTASGSSKAMGLGYSLDCAAGYTTLGDGASDIRAAHGVATWATVSDERYKKDIVDSTAGLSFVMSLTPRTWRYKTLGELPVTFNAYEAGSTEVFKNEQTNHGFIAQEVKAAIDADSGIADGFRLWDDRDDGSQEIAESALIPVLVKAIQEQQALIVALEARLTLLEA